MPPPLLFFSSCSPRAPPSLEIQKLVNSQTTGLEGRINDLAMKMATKNPEFKLETVFTSEAGVSDTGTISIKNIVGTNFNNVKYIGVEYQSWRNDGVLPAHLFFDVSPLRAVGVGTSSYITPAAVNGTPIDDKYGARDLTPGIVLELLTSSESTFKVRNDRCFGFGVIYKVFIMYYPL